MTVDTSSDREANDFQHVQVAKTSMWRSLMNNPKVLFIAFFASYVACNNNGGVPT